MDIEMSRICRQCGEHAVTTSSSWWLATMILPNAGSFERLCSDCAGGRNFVGAVSLIAIAIAAFILAVNLW